MILKIANTTLLCALVLLTAAPAHAEMRTWTSRDGQATLEGKFFRQEQGKVTLVLPNGRAQIVTAESLSQADLDWIAANQAIPAAAPAKTSTNAPVPRALADKLIDGRGNPVSLTEDGAAPKHYLFYYSASWCGPCLAFTPELTKFYRKMQGRNADFEVVLVPSDRSREEAIAYLKDHRMPWPGLDFDHKDERIVPDNNSGYIPAMVLTDDRGKVLLAVNESLPKEEFLDQAEKLLTPDKSGSDLSAAN